MNPGVLSVRNSRVVFVAMFLLIVGGVVAYLQIGRLEDPEFTIKEALIITPYPGASAGEVAQEVTSRWASSSVSSRSPRAGGR
jgi:multidrug efflux pump subunit AcrB